MQINVITVNLGIKFESTIPECRNTTVHWKDHTHCSFRQCTGNAELGGITATDIEQYVTSKNRLQTYKTCTLQIRER